ncbi:FIST C-terminal domain-containing protein, partial [Vibrio campbellii]
MATKTKDRILLEIDNKPALDVYREWTNHQETQSDKESFLFTNSSAYPLGRIAGHLYERPYYKLSHPIRETKQGGIELFTSIQEGESLTLMQGSRQHLVARAARVVNAAFNQKLEESRKIGVINIFCAENKAILSAISAISEARNRHEIFSGLNSVLKKYIDFDDFIVITRDCNQQNFKTLLSTNSVFDRASWLPGNASERALNGECILLFEPMQLKEFEGLNSFIKSQVSSMLLTGIRSEVTQTI